MAKSLIISTGQIATDKRKQRSGRIVQWESVAATAAAPIVIVTTDSADWPASRGAHTPGRLGTTARPAWYGSNRRAPPNPGAPPANRMAGRGCRSREAQVLVGDGGLVVDVANPLEVIDQVMKYFYGLGVHGAKNKAPIDDVQKCFNRALHAASIAAAYRHPKLSAVKHIEQGDTIDGISANATPEELRAEIAKRVALLVDKGYLDLEALPPPANKEVAIADAEGDEQEESD